jgi:hypothetical protein
MLHPSQPQKRYPTQTIGVTAYFSSLGPASISFQDRCLRPLGHSSGSPPRTHLVVILKDAPRGHVSASLCRDGGKWLSRPLRGRYHQAQRKGVAAFTGRGADNMRHPKVSIECGQGSR